MNTSPAAVGATGRLPDTDAHRLAPRACCLLDTSGTVLAAYDCPVVTGLAPADLVGRAIWDAPVWVDNLTTTLRLRQAVAAAACGTTVQCTTFVGPGPISPLVELCLVPLKDSIGQVSGILVEASGLTERGERSDDLNLTGTFFDLMLDVVQDGIVACDATGRLTVVNRAARVMNSNDADVYVDPLDWADRADLFTSDGSRSLAESELPLVRALRGETVRGYEFLVAYANGAMRWVRSHARPILDRDDQLLGAVMILQDITKEREAKARAGRDALHDNLTGLPNGALLSHRLDHAIACHRRDPKDSYALLLVDVDDFKLVNEGYGHLVGDELLQRVSARLVKALRATDAVTRLGSDEFAILLEPPCDEGVVLRVCERIHDALRQPVIIGSLSLHVTASIGATLGSCAYQRAEDPMRDADAALYRAKQSGKNGTALFDLSMSAAVRERITTERDLRVALDRDDQMVLFYQPIMDLLTGRCTGFEALARWRHPERGLLAPGAFLEVAESTSLIVPLGNWSLQEASRQLRDWRRLPGLSDLGMSVNLSGRQLATVHCPQKHLLSFDFPKGLELEVTESTLTDSPEAVAALEALARRGVALSLDDFGTGFASLAAVQRHPISTLKIDRSFVAQLPDGDRQRAIIASVSTLAQHLGLRLIAEGLETRDQVDAVVSMGCRYGQGYYFSRPVPADEALEFARAANGL